jgi:hypothetical protein
LLGIFFIKLKPLEHRMSMTQCLGAAPNLALHSGRHFVLSREFGVGDTQLWVSQSATSLYQQAGVTHDQAISRT